MLVVEAILGMAATAMLVLAIREAPVRREPVREAVGDREFILGLHGLMAAVTGEPCACVVCKGGAPDAD